MLVIQYGIRENYMNCEDVKSRAEDTLEKEKEKVFPKAYRVFKNYIAGMLVSTPCKSVRVSGSELLTIALTVFGGLGTIVWASNYLGLPLLIPSFFASSVILYANHQLPSAQPRNVIGGHVASAAIGVISNSFLGVTWYSITLALIISIIFMQLSGTLHPPAGGTAYIAVTSGQGLDFVLLTVGAGTIVLVVMAMLVNNLVPRRKYPTYWW